MHYRYTREEKSRILNELEASKLSMAAFCRREGLNYPTVYLWKKQLAKGVIKPKPVVQLLEVESPQLSTFNAMGIQVRVGQSVELMFPADYSMEKLAQFCREAQRC